MILKHQAFNTEHNSSVTDSLTAITGCKYDTLTVLPSTTHLLLGKLRAKTGQQT